MNAIKLILNQHARIRKMLANISKSKNPKKLFLTFTKFITHHEKMEQKVWYPFLKKNTQLSTTIKHLVKEEDKASKNITKIKKIKSIDIFEDKFLDLKEDVSHHAREEETKLLPKAGKVLTSAELNKVGKKMQEFKRNLDARR